MISPHYDSSARRFSPISQHAFNLAAFRSPNFLAHGLAFGTSPAYSNYREQHFDSFERHSPLPHYTNHHHTDNQINVNPLPTHSDNYNRPPESRSISTTARECNFPSDYYQNEKILSVSSVDNNSHTATAFAEHRSNDRNQSQHNNNNDHKLNNNYQYHQHSSESSTTVNNIEHSRLSNYNRASSESPERCNSSRSYSASQKSEESDYAQLNSTQQSPENLSSDSSARKANTMLDHHKLPLSFLGPPLAALHSMTEMKSNNNNNNNNCSNNPSNTIPQTHSPISSQNPHSIDTILSRPTPVTTSGLNALTNGTTHKCGEFLLFLVFTFSRLPPSNCLLPN